MKILLAPDSFKGSLSSEEACKIMAKAINDRLKGVEVISAPIADGGEGTLSCFKNYFNYKSLNISIHDHLAKEIDASFAYKDDTVVIESAKACGLTLNRMVRGYEASSYGLGELIKGAILKRRPKRLIITLGGSATNDLGLGLLRALGAKFYNKGHEFIPKPLTIANIDDCNLDEAYRLLSGIEIIGLSDVTNPLCGSLGATAVFGPQKGINKNDIEAIDKGFLSFSELINKKYKKDLKDIFGAGSAGGIGYSILLLGGCLKSGIDEILRMSDFDKKCQECDYIITGEGRLDSQSLNGKVIDGILNKASAYNKRVIILCGINALKNNARGIYLIKEIKKENESVEESILNASNNLYEAMLEVLDSLSLCKIM